ncbi:hypothetical protein [Salinarimonas rosea]|uniref:hypothetical protein n=1 Tax=Salinarimonas rosea TaxID=552063 RepID=UPI0003FE0D9A|nr:hypothetical protein [Salinarimonas rosea]
MSRSSRAHRNPALALLLVLATALLAAVLSAAPAAAQDVLVARWVDAEGGEIARRGFDLAALDALDPIAIETTTPWTEGVGRFEGARLGALAALEPDAGEIAEARLTALNDYTIEVPAQDWSTWDPVLATRLDGTRMRVRDRGPIWLVYPLDADPALRTQRYHARMIWQVREVVFVAAAR